MARDGTPLRRKARHAHNAHSPPDKRRVPSLEESVKRVGKKSQPTEGVSQIETDLILLVPATALRDREDDAVFVSSAII